MYIPIDPGLESPIYKQIADYINRSIVSGRLVRGAKLPTVRELADRLGIARGTITRAYDELARRGCVEMKQGQGTFVIYDKPSMDSRKERAMATIDKLLVELEELNFTPAEMSIFFELKLRERMQLRDELLVVVAGPSPELLFSMAEQVYELGGTDVYKQLIGSGGADTESLLSGADLVIAPSGSIYAANQNQKLVEAAIDIDPDTVAALARLSGADAAAVLAVSEQFLDEMIKALRRYAPDTRVIGHVPGTGITEGGTAVLRDKLDGCTVIVVPEGCSALFPAQTLSAMTGCGLPVIVCRIRMDNGSMLRVRAAAEKAREKRRSDRR